MSATRAIWDAAQGARSAVWLFQTSDEQRRDAPKLPPSLRVASKCGACRVALLAKGTTLGFVARLAVIRIWRQRVSCDECQQTLVFDRHRIQAAPQIPGRDRAPRSPVRRQFAH